MSRWDDRGVQAAVRQPVPPLSLDAVFLYHLTLLYRFHHRQDLRVGLKAFLKAA